jgi:hypothetical protein
MVAANNPLFFVFSQAIPTILSMLTDVGTRLAQFTGTIDSEYEPSLHKQDILNSESSLHAIKD